MALPHLIVFHAIGTDPKKDYPLEFGDISHEFTIKCILTDESAENRLETFRSIPNTVDFFLFYDGKGYVMMCNCKGKGFVRFHMTYHGVHIGQMLLGMTSFKEIALQYGTYGADSSDEE
ncbi:hypothetical protein BGZ68_002307 [Mortierella alpina]|nr:hypothetical protein BGZ68_002307 [Mortierella alpina]